MTVSISVDFDNSDVTKPHRIQQNLTPISHQIRDFVTLANFAQHQIKITYPFGKLNLMKELQGLVHLQYLSSAI